MVKRYDIDFVEDDRGSINEWPDGRYVLFTDYAALGSRFAELQEYSLRLKADKAVLEAECARLRKFKEAYDRLEIYDAIQHKEPT